MKRRKHPKTVVHRDQMFRDGYAVIPNIVIQDKNLSTAALRILTFTLSYISTNYIEDIDLQWLAEMTRLDKQTIADAIDELNEHIFASRLF